jgi:hypothetical protein
MSTTSRVKLTQLTTDQRFANLTGQTTFALLATRDDAAARALQAPLADGFRVDDFFPEAADLPEDIQDVELQSRYGGVGGPLFRTYAAEVERRLWSCPAYRALAAAP